MRYPNPTFLSKASDIRYKRGRLILIVVTCLVVLLTLVLFISKISSMQEGYKERFPELVGAATSETDDVKFTVADYDAIASQRLADATTTTEETTTESVFAPIVSATTSEPDSESTAETSQNNSPERWPEEDNIYFGNSYPLQTISHEERDTALDVLKQQITDYIKDHPSERIGFRYVSLNSNETLGCNDLEMILPSGAYALPIEMLYYRGIADGTYTTSSVRTYNGDRVPGNRSYIADTYQPGKQFYMSYLAKLAIIYNDNLALGFLLDYMGGTEAICPSIAEISGYINYEDTYIYQNVKGKNIKSNHLSSCYDMAAYMRAFYYDYLTEPSVYQPLLNSLANSEMKSGINNIFEGSKTHPVLNITGTNQDSDAYFAMSLVDGTEPFIVCIYAECASADRAGTIQADLSTYLARFISNCHK